MNQLSPAENQYIELCKDFAQGYLKENFKKYDDANCFAESIHEEAFRRGILHAAIPKEYGGKGLSHKTMALSGMAMAEVCAPTTFSMGFNHGTMRPLLKFGTESQKQQYVSDFVQNRQYISWCMTEPEISGSNLFDIRTTATKRGDAWHLEGSKCMIGNGTRSDLF